MNRYDKIVRNIGIVVFILMLGTSVVFGQSAKDDGDTDPPDGTDIFNNEQLQRSTIADRGELNAGGTFELPIPMVDGEFVKNFTAKLSWTDETSPPGRPRVRRYENQPDEFSILVRAPDGNSTDVRGENTIGQSGLLEIVMSLDDQFLTQLVQMGGTGTGNWTVEVKLLNTGAWTPALGPGMLVLRDDSNEFSLSIDYEYYDLNPEEVEE